MLKEYTCIICPNGCEITAEIENQEILSLSGAKCKRGQEYVAQELTAPERTLSTSMLILGGTLPLASVRLSSPIPKERIFDAMEAIKKIQLEAPVCIGQVVIENVLGLKSNVIITKNIPRLD